MISIQQVQFSYSKDNDFRLNIPELEIQQNERLCLTGPSGCGKTTLLKLLTGILKPVSGKIKLGELETSSCHETRLRDYRLKHVGYIFQDFGLLEYLNTLENVLLPFFLSGKMVSTKAIENEARTLLCELGLSKKLKYRPDQLSQGEKQRVSIARSIITKPAIIIADEPTANLDPQNVDIMMDLMMEMIDRNKSTFLMVTHNTLLEKRFARVIHMPDLLEQKKG